MKLIALTAVMLCCLAFGAVKASGYKDRVRAIKDAMTFIEFVRQDIIQRQTPIEETVKRAKKRADMRNIPIVGTLSETDISTDGFETAWAKAVSSQPLLCDEREILLSFASSFCRGGKENGAEVCELTKNRLETLLDKARDDADKKGRLWMSLGAIGGAFAVVVFI